LAATVNTMAEDQDEHKQYEEYREERKALVDAARESARTFDQAVLAFGSVVFGFSIAFIKDIAPKPLPDSLVWLGAAWGCFALGLLSILLSFLFSHRACIFDIECAGEALSNPEYKHPKNKWSRFVSFCNIGCIGLLFVGIVCWSAFAFQNLRQPGSTALMSTRNQDKGTGQTEPRPGPLNERYVPPPPPVRRPSANTNTPPPQK
jgi:hypothetical protein